MPERITNAELSLVDRIHLANPFLLTAEDYAKQLGHPKVDEVIEYLQDFDIREPISNGEHWGLSGKHDLSTPGVVPLVEKDRAVHSYFAQVYDFKPAEYNETTRSIFLNTDTISDKWGGVVLIHEGLHALAHEKGWWRDKPGDWSHWYEEFQVHLLEAELMRSIGGKKYEELIKAQAEDLRLLLAEQRLTTGAMSKTQSIEPVLKLFGGKDTPHERGMIIDAFNLQSYFYLLDESFQPRGDIRQHLTFLRWSHKGNEAPLSIPEILNVG